VAALVVLAYYGWRWAAGDAVVEPAPAQEGPGGAVVEPKAAPRSSSAAPAEGEPPAAERPPEDAMPAPGERARERADDEP
jgi:hypothetical protein